MRAPNGWSPHLPSLKKVDEMLKLASPQLSWSEAGIAECLPDKTPYFDPQALNDFQQSVAEPNQLDQRFAGLAAGEHFCVAEMGFGAGLTFLATAEKWLSQAPKTSQLHYFALDAFPWHPTDLALAQAQFHDLSALSEALLRDYPVLLPGWHEVLLFDQRVRLTLWFGDLLAGLKSAEMSVNVWVLVSEASSVQLQIEQPEMALQVARLSQEQTTFSSVTSSELFKQAYEKGLPPRSSNETAPWFSLKNLNHSGTPKQTAVVVGGGLAGASVAYRLAQMGWQVTVLEASSDVSQQASGNLAGAIHPLVTADWNLRSQFYLSGLEATLRWLQPWWAKGSILGEQNGLMQLAMTETMAQRLQTSLKRVGLPSDFAFWQTSQQASARIGTSTEYGGLFFPQGGWAQPRSVVNHCLTHPNIEVRLNERVIGLQRINPSKNNQAWLISTAQKDYVAEAVVVATGAMDLTLNEQMCLPIRPVKGQVSHYPQEKMQSKLQTTVTHEGYSVQGDFGLGSNIAAISGATFEAPDMTTSLSQASQQANNALVNKALPDWLSPICQEDLLGKVGFRPTTPDHLPIIGEVPDWDWVDAAYLQKSHRHAVHQYPLQRYQRGLYVSNGHGARGLMSVFLAADAIAQSLAGHSPLIPAKLRHAVHPARFVMRSWRKGLKSDNGMGAAHKKR